MPAFDGGVVGDDQDVAAGDAADARHQAGGGRLVVVHVEGGKRRELEKRRPAIEQTIDALAHRQLALIAMSLEIFGAAALPGCRGAIAQLGDELPHAIAIGGEGGDRPDRYWTEATCIWAIGLLGYWNTGLLGYWSVECQGGQSGQPDSIGGLLSASGHSAGHGRRSALRGPLTRRGAEQMTR